MANAHPYRPEDTTTITPYLSVHDGAAALDFYTRAFGAEELFRLANDDGRIEHATMRIGDAKIYLSDEIGGMRSPKSMDGTPVMFYMYVPDCDSVWRQALAAGASVVEPMADKEWGDRYGQLEDPFGHRWGIATMRHPPDE